MGEEKKISLTAKELIEVRYPAWACFGQYNEVGCGLKCEKSTHLLCRKVNRFLRGQE